MNHDPTNMDALLERSALTQAQKDDLHAVYPLLRDAQQEVVKLHADVAIQLLREKAFAVFHAEGQRYVEATDTPMDATVAVEILNHLFRDMGMIIDGVTITRSTMVQMMRDHPEFFSFSPESDIRTSCIALSEHVALACHNSTTLYSADEEHKFTEMRQIITRYGNAYEAELYNCMMTHDNAIEKEEISRFIKKIWQWRDGIIEGAFPEHPEIDGLPLPPVLLEKSRLYAHPLLSQIHAISDKLERHVILCELHDLVPIEPLRIVESGQKSLGRIIEKAEHRGVLPSQLHDLARAMLLTKDLTYIARFEELYAQRLSEGAHIIAHDIECEGWTMSKQGYCDNTTTAIMEMNGQHIGIESQIKLPEQRSAEMKSHRIFEFKRSCLSHGVQERITNNVMFRSLWRQYNDLITILRPNDDRFYGGLIQQYSQSLPQEEHPEHPFFTEMMHDISHFRPIDPNMCVLLGATQREDLLEHVRMVMDDLHAVYHIAGAVREGGASAAMYSALYVRDVMGKGIDNPRLEALLPSCDATPDAPRTIYDRSRGSFGPEDEQRVELWLGLSFDVHDKEVSSSISWCDRAKQKQSPRKTSLG